MKQSEYSNLRAEKMRSKLTPLTRIIVVIHAALSANKALNKRTLSSLVIIAQKLLSKWLNIPLILNADPIEIRNMHVILKMLRDNGLILEDESGNIILNEKTNYILSDLISNRENILIWRLIYEISKLSDYTIMRISDYLSSEETKVLNKEEKEIINELISSVIDKVRYLFN